MANPTAVEAWDEVFVRAPRRTVNAVMNDPALWSEWWPGCRLDGPAEGARFPLVFTSRWPVPARQRLTVTVDRVRPRDKGVEFSVAGDVTGSGEVFHLDTRRGVVVNYLLRGTTDRPLPRLWVAAHRAVVRAGLTGLKDRLEEGLPPGTEPAPALLAEQAEEIEVFRAEVAADLAAKAAAATGGAKS